MSTKPSAWQWRELTAVGGAPAALHDYLKVRGSLTAALQRLAGDYPITVRVLRQRRMGVAADERGRLGLPLESRPWVREVFLECRGRPWVFAHTVIPPSIAKGAAAGLLRLGTRPLGAVLFETRGMRRGGIETVWVPAGLTPYAGLPGGVWGRRSVFRLSGGALLVSEFFLPAMMQALGRTLAGGCRIPLS